VKQHDATEEAKKQSRIPKFGSCEAEARFWDTHNFSNYMKKFKPVKGTFAKNLSQKSTIQRNFGALKSNLPALTLQKEHEAAEETIAEVSIERMGG
jgi:hypothetical protein